MPAVEMAMRILQLRPVWRMGGVAPSRVSGALIGGFAGAYGKIGGRYGCLFFYEARVPVGANRCPATSPRVYYPPLAIYRKVALAGP